MGVSLDPLTNIDGQNREDICCIEQVAVHLVDHQSLCQRGSSRYEPLDKANFL